MNIVRWSPLRDFMNMQERLNQFFRDDFQKESEANNLSMTSWSPSTDIYETKDEYVFKIEVPGMTRDNIEIEFKDDTLIIKGERKEESEVKKEDYHRIERICGSFTRSFNIPKNVDEKKIDAAIKDGILELHIPKKEEAKAKAIPIKIK